MRSTIKTCFSFILLGLATLNAQNNNNLVVFSETGDRFYLILNGLKYNQSPETNVKVTNLNAPNYKAKIIFENPMGDLNANVYLMWEGAEVSNKEFTYAVSKKGDKYKLKFISQADIGGASSSASNSVVYNANGTAAAGNITTLTTTDATTANSSNSAVSTNINGAGYNTSTTVSTSTTTGSGQNGSVGMNMNVDGLSMNINISASGTGAGANTNGSNTNVSTTTTTYTSSTTSYGNTGYAQNTTATAGATGACASPMTEDGFKDLNASIAAKSFEDAKLKVVRQAVSSNCVSSAQVRKLMDLFSFEANKLEITKYCYDYTTDKNNYFKVNDGFSFDSSVDTLNEYISKKK